MGWSPSGSGNTLDQNFPCQPTHDSLCQWLNPESERQHMSRMSSLVLPPSRAPDKRPQPQGDSHLLQMTRHTCKAIRESPARIMSVCLPDKHILPFPYVIHQSNQTTYSFLKCQAISCLGAFVLMLSPSQKPCQGSCPANIYSSFEHHLSYEAFSLAPHPRVAVIY